MFGLDILNIVIWIVCGAIAGVIGKNKGRSHGNWFIIGLVFGPLGVIAALIVGKNEAELDKQALASGDNKKCPFCAELIKSEAIVCKHCGKDQVSKSNDGDADFPK